MRLEKGLHLAMSGGGGIDLTDRFDCNAYLFDARSGEWVLFDAGVGRSPELRDAVLAEDGIDPRAIRHIFLTHGHADHSGGAADLRDRLGLTVHAGALTAPMVAAGDEAALSVDRARAIGIYPADYRYRACPIDDVVVPATPMRIGALTITLIETPGHAADHVSYLVERAGWRFLVAGDALFHGGKVAIQDIPDCDVSAICATVRRLAAIPFDALLPGHLTFSLRDGHRHADAALAYVERFQCPPSII
jgi:hydroxyacylglutathione hydrolase